MDVALSAWYESWDDGGAVHPTFDNVQFREKTFSFNVSQPAVLITSMASAANWSGTLPAHFSSISTIYIDGAPCNVHKSTTEDSEVLSAVSCVAELNPGQHDIKVTASAWASNEQVLPTFESGNIAGQLIATSLSTDSSAVVLARHATPWTDPGVQTTSGKGRQRSQSFDISVTQAAVLFATVGTHTNVTSAKLHLESVSTIAVDGVICARHEESTSDAPATTLPSAASCVAALAPGAHTLEFVGLGSTDSVTAVPTLPDGHMGYLIVAEEIAAP
ncbi:MAG: hypothetical protein JRH20_31695 [Deltaproteobacteria bacterium]|nr:hypothetical protein [Deltaproteobacteria bacterium]